jgi:hypothetical protein
VVATHCAAEAERGGFRTEKKMGIDYSKAHPKDVRLNSSPGANRGGDQQLLSQARHARN